MFFLAGRLPHKKCARRVCPSRRHRDCLTAPIVTNVFRIFFLSLSIRPNGHFTTGRCFNERLDDETNIQTGKFPRRSKLSSQRIKFHMIYKGIFCLGS